MQTDASLQYLKAKRLLRRLSPFVWVFIFSLLIMIVAYFKSNQTDGWSLMAIPIFGGIAIFTILLDYIIKGIIPLGTLKIWLIEIALLIVIVTWYYWL